MRRYCLSWHLKKKYIDVLEAEEGVRHKVWGDALTICLVYPNLYRVGMSNLGFQTIYRLLNQSQSILCERAFLPDPEDWHFFSQGDRLFSLESQRSLDEFDFVAFSVSFENDYPNILKILDLARIPLLSSERSAKDPLIFCGGIAVTLNPEPLANFFDFFLLGEAEGIFPVFLPIMHQILRGKTNRDECFLSLQRDVPGVYVPRFYKVTYGDDQTIASVDPIHPSLPPQIRKVTAESLNVFLTEQALFSQNTEFGAMHLTEVNRGCNRGCRFCAAGYIYRPARFRSMKTLEPSIHRGIERKRSIGLIGTAVSDHPELPAICHAILRNGGKIAIGSLRADRIDRDIAHILHKAGVETVSIAPEAGSQRLRNLIGKGLTEEDILKAADLLIDHHISNLRLYFLIGLPTEMDADIDAIIHMVWKIQHRIRRQWDGLRRFRRITLSVNQFIPKAATPFQWFPLEDIQIVRKRIQVIKSAFRRDPTVRVIHDVPKWNYLQALLSLGDRRIGAVLLTAHNFGGDWSKAYRETLVNTDFFVYRQKKIAETLPWDFIDYGVSKAFLRKEFERALSKSG